MPSLESAWLKIQRAEAHLKSLHPEISRLRPLNGQRVVRDCDMYPGEIVWRFKGPPIPPAPEVGPILGDMLYNLRSALDHLAWSVVEVCGGITKRQTAFPIFKDEALFLKDGIRKVRGMSDEAITLIKENQPYRKWNNDLFLRLWWLEDLCNIDKHRHFNVVVCSMAGGLFDPPLPIHYGHISTTVSQTVLEDGAILARVGAEQKDVQFYPIFDIAVRQCTSTEFIYFSWGLPLIVRRVSDIIRQFETRFFT